MVTVIGAISRSGECMSTSRLRLTTVTSYRERILRGAADKSLARPGK